MTTELDNLHSDADGANENKEPITTPIEETEATVTEVTAAEEAIPTETNVEEVVAEKATEENETTSAADFQEEEESTMEEEEEIPFKNYAELPVSVLIGEAKELLSNHPARKLREHFNQIRDAAKAIFDADEKEKKEAFVAAGGEPLDFHYDNPSKREFNAVYNDYRKQMDAFYKEMEKAQSENLIERNQIIDELKALYLEPNDEISNVFTKFRELKSRWHNAGPISKVQAGNVFKTYFHHLDNFYEYLDLNKELRELDYAHNLQVRESIIKRAETLLEEDNVQKALNELQYLHRLWKEEAVPVAEDKREPTWQKFKDLTNKIHERKSEINEKLKVEQENNLKKKQEIIAQIKALIEEKPNKSHGEWQTGIKKLNALREEFLAIGRAPREFNQKLWNDFKKVTRDFNHLKNDFYKSLKSEQQVNLDKKMELLKIAQEHAESTDWNNSVQVIKKIQTDWKKIGHVPRKYSDKIWKEFKDACNLFFDNYKERGTKENPAFVENLAKKEVLLEEIKAFQASEEIEKDLAKINAFNIRWGSIGKVPAAKMSINAEFNKIVSQMVKDLGLSDTEVQDFKMSSLIHQIKSDQDGRLLDDEIRKSRKLIEDLEKEITQLDTNLSFFANADKNSPLLKNVYKQIEDKRGLLTEAEIRLRKLHQIDFDEEVDDEPTASEEV